MSIEMTVNGSEPDLPRRFLGALAALQPRETLEVTADWDIAGLLTALEHEAAGEFDWSLHVEPDAWRLEVTRRAALPPTVH